MVRRKRVNRMQKRRGVGGDDDDVLFLVFLLLRFAMVPDWIEIESESESERRDYFHVRFLRFVMLCLCVDCGWFD